MSSAQILIVAPDDDDHANAVEAEFLRRNRSDFARLNLESGVPSLILERHWNPESGQRWRLGGLSGPCSEINNRSLRAVWHRRWVKPQAYGEVRFKQGRLEEANLDLDEIRVAVARLVESLAPSLFPLGHPLIHETAENKPQQLDYAREVGFRTPAGIYSTDPIPLARFCRSMDCVIVKPLFRSGHLDETGKLVPLRTQGFSGGKLAEIIQTHTGPVQLFIQECIEKIADWRITVFPNSLWCAEIDTSALPKNDPDWRGQHDQLPHRLVTVDSAFETKLRNYLDLFNLKAGYFDFGVPHHGEPVFFECNTNAEWLWVEHLTGAPLAACVADTLLSPTDVSQLSSIPFLSKA